MSRQQGIRPEAEQAKQRAAHIAVYLAEHFGVIVTDEISTEALRKVRSQVVAHHAAGQGVE